MLYKVVLTFKSVDETLALGDHSIESYWAVLLQMWLCLLWGCTRWFYKSVDETHICGLPPLPPAPTLFLNQTKAKRGWENTFLRGGPLLISMSGWSGSPLGCATVSSTLTRFCLLCLTRWLYMYVHYIKVCGWTCCVWPFKWKILMSKLLLIIYVKDLWFHAYWENVEM